MKKDTKVVGKETGKKEIDNTFVTQKLDAGHTSLKKIREDYTRLLIHLQSHGIPFKHIKARLNNHAKEVGNNKPSWNNGKNTYKSLDECIKAKEVWAIKIDLFLKWVRRNWTDYGISKEAKRIVVETPEQKKQRERASVISAMDKIMSFIAINGNDRDLEALKGILASIKSF